MTERPLSIMWFDRGYLASTLISVVVTIGGWEYAMVPEPGDPEWLEYALMLLSASLYALTILLWALIINHRSRFAKWILTVVTGAALPLYLIDDGTDLRPAMWWYLEAFSVLVGLAALAGLFTSTARRWFKREPDDLAQTFG
jgi:hypothetical protein